MVSYWYIAWSLLHCGPYVCIKMTAFTCTVHNKGWPPKGNGCLQPAGESSDEEANLLCHLTFFRQYGTKKGGNLIFSHFLYVAHKHCLSQHMSMQHGMHWCKECSIHRLGDCKELFMHNLKKWHCICNQVVVFNMSASAFKPWQLAMKSKGECMVVMILNSQEQEMLPWPIMMAKNEFLIMHVQTEWLHCFDIRCSFVEPQFWPFVTECTRMTSLP